MKRFSLIVLAIVMLFAFSACKDEASDIVTTDKDNGEFDFTDIMVGDLVNKGEKIDANATYYAYIGIEEYGAITVKLDQSQAPITVQNFVDLATGGFYDGLTFHRIMEGFMMQGGDPNGDGSGGSENKIVGEFKSNGYNNTISHVRGVISMARRGDYYNDSLYYNTASSQFFIMHADSLTLDGDYAASGYVTEGMDVVDKVCTSVKPIDNNGTIPSYVQPVINKIVISKVVESTVDTAA